MRYSRDTLTAGSAGIGRRLRRASPLRADVCCAPIPRCWRWLPHSSGNLRTATGRAPSNRPLRLFRRCELIGPTAGDIGGEVFGRFEAETPTTAGPGTPCMALDRWAETYLFALSMIIPGCSAATDQFAEDAVRLGAALQPALAARGSRPACMSTTDQPSSTNGRARNLGIRLVIRPAPTPRPREDRTIFRHRARAVLRRNRRHQRRGTHRRRN